MPASIKGKKGTAYVCLFLRLHQLTITHTQHTHRAKQATLQKAKPSTSTSLAFIPNTSSSSSPSSSSPSSKFKSFLQWIGIVGQGRGGGRNEAAAAAAKERQHMRGGEGVAVHRDLRVGFVVATSPCKDDHGQVERSFEQLVKVSIL